MWVETSIVIQADVIRWKEAVFERRGRKSKATRIGDRIVTAEVLRTEEDWLYLLVRGCTSIESKQVGRTLPLLSLDAEIKRAKKTILRGKPERLLWSEESVRERAILEQSDR